PLPCEVDRPFLPTRRCLDPPRRASHRVTHPAPLGARQCFWACIAFWLPPSPLRCWIMKLPDKKVPRRRSFIFPGTEQLLFFLATTQEGKRFPPRLRSDGNG